LCQEIPKVFRCIVGQHVLAYELVLTRRAIRAIRSGLPEGIAAAVIEFLTGVLVENPHRVGRRLRGAAEGLYQLISPVRSRFAVDGIGAACYGSMARPLGLLAGVLGRRTAVRDHFAEALRAHRACGAAMLVAETMHDFGRALALVDDHDASERAVGKARPLFRSLGMEHRAELIVAAAAEPAPDGNVFRREGEYWTLTYGARTARVGDTKGLQDIAVLLANQGREIHVADLIA
jgi:hypothetical protein